MEAEAQRCLDIAGKLLEARDLPAAKKFAEQAIDADPLLDGPDQIIATADVLAASNNLLPGGQTDHYSILQLPHTSDLPSIKRSYRRLALLLRPDRHTSPSASLAFQLVSDSFTFLSDDHRRALYDDGLRSRPVPDADDRNDSPSPPPKPEETYFWTLCPNCFRSFEYAAEYEGRRLLCQVCRNPFPASKLPSAPPIVPGTDMFYCSWGMFPVGYPGGFSSVEVPPGTPYVSFLPQVLSSPEPAKRTDAGESARTRISARLRAVAESGALQQQRRKAMARRPKRGVMGGVELDINDGGVEPDHLDRAAGDGVNNDAIAAGIGIVR